MRGADATTRRTSASPGAPVLAGPKAQTLQAEVDSLRQRCSDLEDQIEADGRERDKLRLELARLAKEMKWEAEKAERTATALFERIELVRRGQTPRL